MEWHVGQQVLRHGSSGNSGTVETVTKVGKIHFEITSFPDTKYRVADGYRAGASIYRSRVEPYTDKVKEREAAAKALQEKNIRMQGCRERCIARIQHIHGLRDEALLIAAAEALDGLVPA